MKYLMLFIAVFAVVQFIHVKGQHATSEATTVEDTDNDSNDTSRIVNGAFAGQGQFPWMAGIHGYNNGWEKWRCGGTLIARNLVLTAKHCVDATPRAYRITLGSNLPGDAQDGAGKTIRYADLIITHGEALMFRLSESVQFSSTVQPVRLPTRNDYVGAGVAVTVSGWGGLGEDNSGSLSERLMYTTLNTITNDDCKKWYALRDDVVCYVNQRSTTCGGDSGSPVVRYVNNVAVHVGIHDAGVCKVGWPSVATRTTDHIDWINSEIRRHAP